MYAKIADFVVDWKRESAGTAKVLDALTDASLAQQVSKDDDRTLGGIAWHIVTAIPEMLGRTGLSAKSLAAHAPMPAHASDIAAAYRSVAGEVLSLVQSQWNDAALAVEDDMYGMKWARGLTLEVLQRHEIHHRAQMTILMRQAGLKVPGVYGPSREEWEQRGMKPPKN